MRACGIYVVHTSDIQPCTVLIRSSHQSESLYIVRDATRPFDLPMKLMPFVNELGINQQRPLGGDGLS